MNIKLYTNGRDLTDVVFAEPALGLRLGDEATLASFDLLSVNRKDENISLGILGPVYTPVVGRNCRIVYWKKVRVYQERCPLSQGKLVAFAAQTNPKLARTPLPLNMLEVYSSSSRVRARKACEDWGHEKTPRDHHERHNRFRILQVLEPRFVCMRRMLLKFYAV